MAPSPIRIGSNAMQAVRALRLPSSPATLPGASSPSTRESQSTRPFELRFRATLGGDQEAEVTLIQRQIQSYPEFAADLAERPDPVFMLTRIFGDRQITKLDERPVEFRCFCSKERVRRSLLLLGISELRFAHGKPAHSSP